MTNTMGYGFVWKCGIPVKSIEMAVFGREHDDQRWDFGVLSMRKPVGTPSILKAGIKFLCKCSCKTFQASSGCATESASYCTTSTCNIIVCVQLHVRTDDQTHPALPHPPPPPLHPRRSMKCVFAAPSEAQYSSVSFFVRGLGKLADQEKRAKC
jgi:hypothetical protein